MSTSAQFPSPHHALVAVLTLVCALFWPTPQIFAASSGGASADKPEVSDKKADLRDLREKIDTLQKNIANAEGSRADAADQLKDAERSISQLQRELRELGDERESLQFTLRELSSQSRTLKSRLQSQQQQLARLLERQYQQGSFDTLQLLLNGRDSNQISRDLYYLGTVAQARSAMLSEIESTLSKMLNVAERTENRATVLAAVEQEQKEKHDHLRSQRESKRTTLGKISARIAAQKKEVGSLQRDEKRMTHLVSHLSQLIVARERAQVSVRVRVEKQHRLTKFAQTPAVAAQDVTPAGDLQSTQVDDEPPPQAVSSHHFARQKGRLRLPVNGAVANRFGSPRQEGAMWKGVFIRSPEGGEVRAIAAGQVVFSEWMRGFGNLLIIDHGDSFLSIYGNNDALLKRVGDSVHGGEAIATVGSSGGNPESGLYFEIRHQGQPVDPLRWASFR